jgi:hypothetical protein
MHSSFNRQTHEEKSYRYLQEENAIAHTAEDYTENPPHLGGRTNDKKFY